MKKLVILVVAVLGAAAAAFGAARVDASTADDPHSGTITYWYWAESDAPGANAWMKQMIARYEKRYPKVQIKLVLQATDTLIGAFRTAAQTHSGPDIATQWATLPTLTPAWIKASVPISDYVPSSEVKNWIGTAENVSSGKVWAMPIYLLGVPFVWNKQLFAKAGLPTAHGPRTWKELLADCAALKAHGITPIGMGNKDGYTGAWFFSLVGKQNLDSIDELKKAMLGDEDFSKPKFSGFYGALADLKKRGCFNSDIASLDLNQGWQLFPQKKAAMAWTTDGNALAWEKTLGASAIGVGKTPVWGTGNLATSYDTTQSSDAFITSWSKHKSAAAAFLAWLHLPAQLQAWYQATKVFPADHRFAASNVKDPIARQLFKLDTTGPAVWPENFLPPQVDQNADLPAGEMITSGSGTPAQATALWVRVIKQWRQQHPDEYGNYKKWASG
jgi:ABC-type glycerol-3-phosphate transport system substrate-binding protein